MKNAVLASLSLAVISLGLTASAHAAGKKYPPHGYPCLGCYPCPPSYCDNDNKRVIKFTPDGEPVSAKHRAVVKSKSNVKNN